MSHAMSPSSTDRSVTQEMCLVRLGAPGHRLGEILTLSREFGARVITASSSSLVLALMDAPGGVTRFLQRLAPYGIHEVTRSGRIALPVAAARGARPPRPADTPAPAGDAPRGHPASALWQADGFTDDEAAA